MLKDSSQILMAKSGMSFPQECKSDEPYLANLERETSTELFEFSKLFFKVYGDIENKDQARQNLRTKANKIVDLEKDNMHNLLQYIEYLILHRGLNYFLIIHYLISIKTKDPKENFESLYKQANFNAVGKVYDIMPELA